MNQIQQVFNTMQPAMAPFEPVEALMHEVLGRAMQQTHKQELMQLELQNGLAHRMVDNSGRVGHTHSLDGIRSLTVGILSAAASLFGATLANERWGQAAQALANSVLPQVSQGVGGFCEAHRQRLQGVSQWSQIQLQRSQSVDSSLQQIIHQISEMHRLIASQRGG